MLAEAGNSELEIDAYGFGIPPIDTRLGTKLMPIQHKDSEELLVAALACASQTLGKSPVLKALAKFAEENDIDTIIFNSGVKVGNNGSIQLNNADARSIPTTYKQKINNFETINTAIEA